MYEIRKVGARRGVYATQDIPADTLIVEDPVIVIPRAEWDTWRANISLYPSVYFWKANPAEVALVMGALSLIQYADEVDATCRWEMVTNRDLARLWSKVAIANGDELTVYWTDIGLLDPVA